VEDGLLDIYMQVDEKGKLEKVRDGEVKAAEADHAAAKKKNDGEVADLDRRISELAAQREQLLGGVEKEILARYERVLKAKDDGVALAPVTIYESVEDEGVVKYWGCGGCSVKVPAQDVNQVKMGRDMVSCRSCSRILYWKEEPKPATP
jgi:predicted  nucleic acid-binding Zn-ribbon protein